MGLSCFRPNRAEGAQPIDIDDRPEPVRRVTHARKASRLLARQGSGSLQLSSSLSSTFSSLSTTSNESISKLPPCPRRSDPKIEAMMMPIPTEPNATSPRAPGQASNRCLRLSYPKTYSAIMTDMKACRGCRDWRNFAVFPADDIDPTMSADTVARKKARDYERKLAQFASFSDSSDAGEIDLSE